MNMIQAPLEPAEVDDRYLVPALFEQWGPLLTVTAAVRPGDHVLDVACGTGAATLVLAEQAGPRGLVIGLDASPEMLGVARRKSARITWMEGRAEAPPLPDAAFDAVVSQFGLMLFDDRVAALGEMMRVLRRGWRLAVAVCDCIDNAPGYAVLAGLLDRLFGRGIGDAFRAPFVLGDRDVLLRLAHDAGIADARAVRHGGSVRFASVADLVSTERACAWTLGGLLDNDQLGRLLAEAETALEPFAGPDGAIVFDMPALIVTATKH